MDLRDRSSERSAPDLVKYGLPTGLPRTIEIPPTRARPVRLEPPGNGSIFRFFVLAPPNKQLSAQQLEEQAADGFRAIGGEHCRVDTRLDPAMHTTRTVDYIILLKGDVTLVLDEDEVRLKPFDVVVQRGTNHAWRNNGSEPALLAGVLIDALPV